MTSKYATVKTDLIENCPSAENLLDLTSECVGFSIPLDT